MIEEKKLGTLAIILLILIGAVAVAFLTISACWTTPSQNNVIKYTETYTNVTAEEAYNLINKTSNLTIIDCRGCACKWRKGHLPGAVHNINAEDYVNWTNDILVYGDDTAQGLIFCEELLNTVYGKIYNLKDGFKSWQDAGYPIEKAE